MASWSTSAVTPLENKNIQFIIHELLNIIEIIHQKLSRLEQRIGAQIAPFQKPSHTSIYLVGQK